VELAHFHVRSTFKLHREENLISLVVRTMPGPASRGLCCSCRYFCIYYGSRTSGEWRKRRNYYELVALHMRIWTGITSFDKNPGWHVFLSLDRCEDQLVFVGMVYNITRFASLRMGRIPTTRVKF
jgi:hypothetical protein